MRALSGLFITLALLTLAGCIPVTSAPEHTITVSGSSDISAVPDMMKLDLRVVERGATVPELKTQVDLTTSRLLDYLTEQGVDAKDISSYEVQVHPEYRYDDGERQLTEYNVQRQINLTLRNPQLYDAILNFALQQGVTNVGSPVYEISNARELYQQALNAALADARSKATALAVEGKLTLTGIQHIREQTGAPAAGMEMSAMRMQSDKVSLPGQQDVRAQVEVVFTVN
ncbi:SIMPL domain-containing protein [Pseudidiomarina sp.]|uniref:SIMPL domain-containing protein n=1 Tax=Pseudidiomarina sp. TaxID=2081707 RepID=UPI00299DA27D|nr:SIMPL domain-containing protein [Pseudidiomarina sp.]MDX1706099.1 SIMPL domain-containing protein [Pseudidiomarina sp.]